MINYLLNATTIWLACLLIYELLLRNETWHHYNRLYLNLGMLAGLAIPLLQWNTNTSISNQALRQPVEQAYVIRRTITNAAPDTQSTPGVYNILLLVYLIGVAFFMVMILRDAIQLIKYYREGKHTQINNFIVVETGKEHGPFSMFKIIFVRTRAEFDQEQWQLLLIHEMQHSKLKHSIDKCFALMLRALLWFHPLVYVYYKRLMIVHEYQADAPAKKEVKAYGSFLLEQSMLMQAPILAHSFNYSPLKNRIRMLTRKNSSKIRLVKYLAIVPILSLLLLCCTKNNIPAKERKGSMIYFNGNTFELQTGQVDSIEVFDPVSKTSKIVVTKKDSAIGKMNGEKVYDFMEITEYPTYIGKDNLLAKITETLQTELSTLDNGDYGFGVNDLIVDKKGVLVYYNGASMYIYNKDPKAKMLQLDPLIKAEMAKKLDELFNAGLEFKPATLNGKPVIGYVNTLTDGSLIHVENHVASVKQNNTKH